MKFLLDLDGEIFDHAGFPVCEGYKALTVVRTDISKLHRHDEIPDRSEVCPHKSSCLGNISGGRPLIVEYNILDHTGTLKRSDRCRIVRTVRLGQTVPLKVDGAAK